MSQAPQPTAAQPETAVPTLAGPGQRIDSLDLLRGIAILGIFVMNTWTMSLPQAAYTNPAAYSTEWVYGEGFPGGERLHPPEGSDFWVYSIIHLFADMKFITMFSIMFGAGMVLQSERSSKKGRNPWLVHYLRMAVLLVFGLCHTFGFWYGDILTDYAMSGMILAPFRKLRPVLLMLGGMLLIGSVTLVDLTRVNRWLDEPVTIRLGSVPVTIPAFIRNLETYEGNIRYHYSNLKDYGDSNDHELDTYRGTSLAEQGASRFEIWKNEITGHRMATSINAHTAEFILWTFPRCAGCMLLGMAL